MKLGWLLAWVPFVVGCGGDDASGGASTPDAASDVGAGGSDAGPDVEADVEVEASLPDTSIGPSFVGTAESFDGTTPADIALGFFWDAAGVTVVHDSADCVAFVYGGSGVAGRDVGEVTITGGSVAPIAALARDDTSGAYTLDSPLDVWDPGDALSLSADGVGMGPLVVPAAFASENLSTQTTVNRDGALPLVFSGSDSTHVGLSLTGADGDERFLLICVADASTGSYAVPAEAMGSIPGGVTMANIKLSPVNREQRDALAFFVAGQAAEVDATIAQ